ncbi:hypothetical protein C0993_012468 [Termitomyces sp. T159_Od127]|nr:hypothetical protein C0993_012468 [Termitomyces sp. T159_Od127]
MNDTLPTPNIVLFGESGSGKSSIVNMIGKCDTAPVGSNAQGVTLSSTCYRVEFEGSHFNVYDTAGLDEADEGSVPKREAVVQLYRLLKSLETGVNLLIFCWRAPRIKDNTYKNWRLFHEIICDCHVPIVLAITGLEQEDDMDHWWLRNKGGFQKYQIHPNGVACITATRGRQLKSGAHRLDEEYEESQMKMWKQIRTYCLEEAWKVPPVEWLRRVMTVTYETRLCQSTIEHRTFHNEAAAGLKQLVARCELSEKDAWELSEALSKE